MSGRGRNFTFHGAYKKKSDAVHEEKKVHGFIRHTKIHGHWRYVVMKPIERFL
jgi:hypothetical protein